MDDDITAPSDPIEATPADQHPIDRGTNPRRTAMIAGVMGLSLGLGIAGLVFGLQASRAPEPEPAAVVIDEPEPAVEEEPPPEEPAEPEPLPPPDPQTVDWRALEWRADCFYGEWDRAPGLPTDFDDGSYGYAFDPANAIYSVEIDGGIYEDLTGDGAPDAIFPVDCLSNYNTRSIAVWTWDDEEWVQLPQVYAYDKSTGYVDTITVTDGAITVATREPRPGDEQPWLNDAGYPVTVETAYRWGGTAWIASELSRNEPAPAPAAAPRSSCSQEPTTPEAATKCLIAAINAGDAALASTVAEPSVVSELLSQANSYGPIDWEFSGCRDSGSGMTCWWETPLPPDADYHGVGIEMGVAKQGRTYVMTWIAYYG
jgi:hypothetical protein